MIKVENLSKTFSPGNIQAVKNISFELGSGEIGCLIGTSGCGKTTTLKMINRLVEPTEGKIWINDRQHQSTDAIQWRRHIGYVIQKAGLLPHLTVFQNISLLSRILKKSETDISNRVKELMGVINMPYEQFKDRYPVELSGGQQQRIGIARALMEDPPILLMDEPFGALDPLTRQSLHNELTLLNKKLKKTILIVTHDIREAFKLGTQIFLMHQGEIIQKGVQNDFLNSPTNQFVEDFVKGQLA